MTTNRTLQRRLAAGAGALALGMMTAVGVAGTASAAPPNGNPPPAQAGAGATGVLTVHKRVGAQGAAGNGTSLGEAAPGSPLPGVTFSRQRIGVWTAGSCVAIDLRTTAGWTAAAAASAANPPAPVSPAVEGSFCASGGAASAETLTNGTATFDNLELGLYYVTETNVPANVVERAAPFYVTIPFSSVSGGATTWLYEVHAYPKNSTAARPTKTISDRPSALVVGSTVTWTIAQTIPSLTGASATFSEASVADNLDSRLTYVSAVVAIADPTGAQLDSSDYTVGGAAPAVTWTFNESGRAKLAANQGKQLTVALTTTVTSIGTGTITNDGASVSFNNVPQTPEIAPRSYWGTLVVNKFDASDASKRLQGAEFAVFEKGEQACAATNPGGTPTATGVTDVNGVVQWAGVAPTSPLGLWIQNSATEVANPTKDYCLYETKAPAGYTAIATPWTVTITTANNALATQDIANTPVPGPVLPLTGAEGTMLFTLAGVALVAVAGGGFLVRRARASRS